MLEAHLSTLCSQTKPKLRTQLASALTTALSRVGLRITHGRISVPVSANINSHIQQLQRSQQPYEQQLREHRLKEALRLQQELSERLTFVADTINTLAAKPKDKLSRKQIQEEEEKKKQESEEFTSKLREQQKAIELRREKAMAESALQQLQWEAHEKQQAEEHAKALAAERDKRVEQLRAKRLERERYLNQAKQRAHESPEPRPELNVSLLEFEHPKPAAARLPVSKEELEEHQRKYEELRKLGEERRRQRQLVTASAPHLPLSKSLIRLLNEEKKQREEAERQTAQRLQILEKQRKYAQIVRTEHLPVIDKKKAAEVQALKEPKKRSISPEPRLNVTMPPRPRIRAKPKPKEEPPEDTKPEPRDYIGEQRKMQLGHLSSTLDRLQALDSSQLHQLPSEEKRAKVAALEAQARRSEALLSRLDPADSAALRMEEGVNSLLLSSIKAKMTLLAPAA